MPFDPRMEKYPISWLFRERQAGRLNTDLSIQREFVWTPVLKGNFITSLIKGIPIGVICLEKNGKKYSVIDGKNRIITIETYLKDLFTISSNVRNAYIDDISIIRKKFSGLPLEMQNTINDRQIYVEIYNSLTTHERNELFFMRNQSRQLAKIDLVSSLLGEEGIETLKPFVDHKFMREKIKWGAAARRNKDDLKIIIYLLILMYENDSGFSGKVLEEICNKIYTSELKIQNDDIIQTLDFMYEALETSDIKQGRTYFKVTHLPVILFMAKKAIDNKMDKKDFIDKLDEFFTNTNEEYLYATRGGSAKRTNIQIRLDVMENAILT